MKPLQKAILAGLFFTLNFGAWLHYTGTVEAQSTSGVMVLLQVGAPSTCQWPTGATVTNGMAICSTNLGLYYALNGSATFQPVAPAAAAGVTSFNGATGAVTSASLLTAGQGIKYSDLAAPPTTVNCQTTGCTIK